VKLIGSLLRIPYEAVRARMLSGLHERGYTDLVAAHLNLLLWPGPENQRPSELATQTRMSKQALNYLLGQLEQLAISPGETTQPTSAPSASTSPPEGKPRSKRSAKSSTR